MPRSKGRQPLRKEGVVAVAIDLADRDGLHGLSMRTLAKKLRVEPMSLYHHFPSKEALLDAMVDRVFAEMHAPKVGGDWKREIRRRAHSAREVLKRHRWAIGLMDSRSTPGMETLQHHDAVIGCLREAGFSLPLTAHAFAVLDAHLYGFIIQELSLPFEPGEDLAKLGRSMLGALPPGFLTHFREFVVEHALQPGYAFAHEFDFGLELILDGLEQRKGR